MRCAAVGALVTITSAVVGGLVVAPLADLARAVQQGAVASTTFDTALVWLCACVALPATCWLWLTSVLVLADAWRGQAVARRGVPDVVRRVVLALCGLAVAGGFVGSVDGAAVAVSADVHSELRSRTQADVQPPLSGLRLPERVSVAPAGDPVDFPAHQPVPAAVRATRTVLVGPGDTLWGLAARVLGPDATDAEVARAWPLVYERNRELIGPDPGHILPGQLLEIPAGLHGMAER